MGKSALSLYRTTQTRGQIQSVGFFGKESSNQSILSHLYCGDRLATIGDSFTFPSDKREALFGDSVYGGRRAIGIATFTGYIPSRS